MRGRGRRLARVVGTVGAGGAAAAVWSTVVEPRWFALRQVVAPVLPDGAAAVRVLHVSDLHLVPGQRRKAAWMAGLADLRPDLVVSTGDALAHKHAVPAALAAYDALLERPGVFVLGSNDYFPPVPKNPLRYLDDSHSRGQHLTPDRLPTHELVAGFRRAGWVDLTNTRARLEVSGLVVDLVGVDDPHLGYDRFPAPALDPDARADLRVGVTHAPYRRVLDAMTRDGADLVLAGHTHGGQVCLPGCGALVTNCDLDTRRAQGLSRWWPGAGATPSRLAPPDAAWLHVSAGLGASPWTPFRLACRPEATLLTLVPRP